ncbi:FecR family protein [Desertivirga brevis]|uniref:FecR family protein n=1 Tax=Desertivirga brevis TaxID=2810310 RepID=UPI001A965CE1|nr:FecR domain-containing protein [Pedobacter sp. SYSU D00873]
MKEDKDIISLMFQKLGGTISPEDDEFLNDRLLEDEELREKWKEIETFGKSHSSERFLKKINEETAWSKIEAQIEKLQAEEPRKYSYKFYFPAAAICIITFALSIYFYLKPGVAEHSTAIKKQSFPAGIKLTLQDGTSVDLDVKGKKDIDVLGTTVTASEDGLYLGNVKGDSNQWSTLSIPAKLDYKIVLADGTEVFLNSSSSLKFPIKFTGIKREVFLAGEAYFKVARDEKKPFIVHTPETDVQVLGTEFNIDAYTPAVVTSLVHGAVKTSAGNGDHIVLHPGIQAKYLRGKGFSTSSFDPASVTSWMAGSYHFEDEDLATIAKIIPRWFDINSVVFDNKSLEDLRITGEINKHKPLNLFLHNIEAATGAKCILKGDVLHLK